MLNDRLPPGQQLVAAGKWPTVGERLPKPHDGPWTLTITGGEAADQTWTLDQLRNMPQVWQTVDIHCVTRWSKLGIDFSGVPLAYLLDEVGRPPDARFVSFVAHSNQNHSTSLPLNDVLSLNTLVALEAEGQPLPQTRGGPVRVVVPGRYFYKSLKWLTRIDLLREDRLGFWEASAGYHNTADPWLEQRYLACGLSKQDAAKLIASRNFSERDLRSINASDRELTNLNARSALLRDANFQHCDLRNACFVEANLSNAHFEDADLRGASFERADLEGADFIGADLRGVDFRGASLLSATFCDESGEHKATIDETSRIDTSALDDLIPCQREFVQSALQVL